MTTRRIVLGLATALLTVLAACSGDGRRADEGAPPPDILRELLPAVPLGLPGRDGGERRFDVNVRGIEARTFFLSLVEGTAYNVAISPEVRGTLTMSLQNATLPEIFDTAREVYGYDYRRAGLTYTVLPAGLQTRTFQVNYLNLKRQGKSRMRVTSGQITESLGSDSGGGTVGQQGQSQQNDRVSAAGSNVETQTDSDFWQELSASLNLIVKPGSSGHSLSINPESGVAVVRATPRTLRDVGDFLRAVHTNLHRQVVLEAKIVEVSLSDRFQAGINWAALTVNGNDTILSGQVGGANVLNNGLSAISGSSITITPGSSAPVTSFTSTATGGAFFVALNFPDFNGVIEFLKSQGDVQVLSSPRISTVNNQKAIIKVGTDEFFVTGVQSNQTQGGGGSQQNQQIQITPFFSGIALDVTARIYEPDEVILHIHPTVSEVREQPKNLVVGGQAQSLPLALSTLRETDSIVRARSGQVIVIGGLMQDKVSDERFSTPILGSIPLLGMLFRQTRRITTKSELVVLLKPTVMGDDDSGWDDQIRRTRKRMGTMDTGSGTVESWIERQ